jgi:predicted ArsR family transcriptional regulator
MTETSLDPADLRILSVLQSEGRIANVDLAERVGLSPSPCLRRTKQLETSGTIRGYVARRAGQVVRGVAWSFHAVGSPETTFTCSARGGAGHPDVGCGRPAVDYLHILARDLDAYGLHLDTC